jgi:hypothetical protein
MNNFKNYLIALLVGLLAISLFTQPAQSAGKSVQAKAIEYELCLKTWNISNSYALDYAIKECAKYRP